MLNISLSRTALPALPQARSLFRMAALRRERHDLANLDAHLLEDIGLTSDQAQAEARRPIWDAPAHWWK